MAALQVWSDLKRNAITPSTVASPLAAGEGTAGGPSRKPSCAGATAATAPSGADDQGQAAGTDATPHDSCGKRKVRSAPSTCLQVHAPCEDGGVPPLRDSTLKRGVRKPPL